MSVELMATTTRMTYPSRMSLTMIVMQGLERNPAVGHCLVSRQGHVVSPREAASTIEALEPLGRGSWVQEQHLQQLQLQTELGGQEVAR